MAIVKEPEIELKQPFFSKTEYVYQLLKDKIENGYLEQNKIYTIVEIAQGLGISRTPVGEAVKILASRKYINLYQGVGFKVKELTKDDIRENLTISGALEVAVLKRIIRDGTNTIGKLEQAVAKSWRAMENQTPVLYTQSSAEFHKAFYALAALPRVTEILHENVFVYEIWYREGASRYPEAIKRLIVDHENIIKIIKHADYGQIAEVINAHVENCEEVLLKVIPV
jgi:GntR family transcriptional regulator, trigonelline degradation regulator